MQTLRYFVDIGLRSIWFCYYQDVFTLKTLNIFVQTMETKGFFNLKSSNDSQLALSGSFEYILPNKLLTYYYLLTYVICLQSF